MKGIAEHEDEDHEEIVKDEVEEEWEKGIPPFVRKLTKMVGENVESIDWTSGGSFIVKDIDYFSATLLPKYFKSIKFCSFVRQLNMYNFHKLEDQPNSPNKSMEFKNNFFLPGRKDLLKKIHRRKTVKRNMKEEEEEEKTPKHETTTSPQQPQLELNIRSNYSLDENSYKGLLHAVLKLQQQNEMSQLALKQVLEELAFVRKSHYELSEKVQQLSVTGNNNNSNGNNSSGFAFSPPSYNNSSPTFSAPSPFGFLPIPVTTGPAYNPTGTASSSLNFSNVYPSPSDLSAILFEEGSSSNSLNGSTNGTTRSLLNLMQQQGSVNLLPSSSDKTPTFDFNNLQQQLIEESSDTHSPIGHAGNPSHRNGIPISMYDNSNHFDVFS